MRGASDRVLLPLFTLTAFFTAYLLFLIQPMMGRIILPWFGGTPAVWNACMFFFQVVLLIGYFYSFALSRWVSFRLQPFVHGAVLGVGLLFFPISRNLPEGADLLTSPALWVMRFLGRSIGWPFFALSTTAPLLQHWFSRTTSRHARDPYFLYSASNAGSLIGLLGYPLLIEPALALPRQTDLLFGCYLLIAALVLGSGVASRAFASGDSPAAGSSNGAANQGQGPNTPDADTESTPGIGDGKIQDSRREEVQVLDDEIGYTRGWWLFCSFVPSTLLLGLTSHLTTNVASFPLLWVVPFALYLLTFILVFSGSRFADPRLAQRVFPYLALVILPSFYRSEFFPLAVSMLLHLGLFFCAAIACHGRLAALRPDRSRLTEYYLLMSIGGALGGMFNSFVAPVVFVDVHEYPLAIILAAFCLPARPSDGASDASERSPHQQDFLHPLALAGIGSAVVLGLHRLGLNPARGGSFFLLLIVTTVACFSFQRRPLRFGLGLAAVLAVQLTVIQCADSTHLSRDRNFFGVKRVILCGEGRFHRMFHGDTVHGSQRVTEINPETASPTPLTYYHAASPIGELLAAFRSRGTPMRIGVIGLGVGSLAAYSWDSSQFVFFEIDPDVDRLARDTRLFTFLARARGECRTVLGDGRQTLAGFPAGSFDLLILDAYSSDAIPVNLLTREALELYFSRLTPGGFLAFHISNRHLRLAPLLGRLAADARATAFHKILRSIPQEESDRTDFANSHWAALSRRPENLEILKSLEGWVPLPSDPAIAPWTDDYSNILSLF